MPKSAFVSFRLEDDMLQAFDEIVSDGPGDRSDHIRQALANYIYEYRRKRRFLEALAVADEKVPA